MIESTKTVLVVDDDSDIRDVLNDVLTCEGFDVAAAADGWEALRYLRTQPPPGLILLDFMMPRCDGPTFRAEQRKDPALATIPVAWLSADAKLPEKAEMTGTVGCLRKPVDLRELLDLVRKYCDE